MSDRIIFHIDVNSAFLSWTAIKMLREGSDIDIRTIPAAVGGNRQTRHGVVLAKSIPAKNTGIKTGEPIAKALQKCPELVIVPPEHSYYNEQSKKLMDLLRQYTPDIEQVSVDECYMDYTGIKHRYSTPKDAAFDIKERVKKELGFTVNIGISDVKVLAKMASDFTKPDRIHTLYRDEIKTKMWPLPIEDLFMAGRSSVDTLHKLGIENIGQLANSPVEILQAHLKSHGRTLWEFANGIDDSEVNPVQEEAKGVGNSVTLPYDVDNIEDLNKILLQLSQKVGGRLRKGSQLAKTVAVEIKYSDFIKVSRQTTVEHGICADTEIYEISKKLLKELWNHRAVRLLGVRTSNLTSEGEPEQLSIMDILNDTGHVKEKHVSGAKLKKLDEALDSIKNKYGSNAVMRASLLNNTGEDDEE